MGKVTILPPSHMSRREWVKRITASWKLGCDSAIGSFIQTGLNLMAAKDDLEHGEWLKMIGSKYAAGELPFQKRVAQRLMIIAKCEAFKSVSLRRLLPPDYNTICQIEYLYRRFPSTFDEWIEEGRITPSLQRGEINKVLRLERVAADEKRVLNLRPIVGKFRTIVLDPAWEYKWMSIAGRAKPGYAMQTIEQLRAIDVRAWAEEEPGAHLYVWTTNNFMGEAIQLVEHWGFKHRTILTWIKPPPFGMGSYFRNSTEHCVFAQFGKLITRPAAASIPTHFEAPRGEHSEKPEKFYEIVRAASYPPYGEGNQREARADFTNLYCPVTDAPEDYKPEAAE